MAERTGDPVIDKLIEEFLGHEIPWLDEDADEDADEEMLPIAAMRDPLRAEGMCGEITTAFQAFVWHETDGTLYPDNAAMSDGTTIHKHDPSFEEMGYGDRKPGEPSHLVSKVETPGGVYLIDWTAAQYGYKEFPMVQRFDPDSETWQREFAPRPQLAPVAAPTARPTNAPAEQTPSL